MRMVERTEVSFDSGGVDCAAYLYRPAGGRGPVPCVVMANGFSATRDDLLPAYAERFAAAGLAVVLFDYRYFGASGGRPRQLIDIGRQQEDYHSAIRYARSLEGVDKDRIVLWGTSFSGGHVIAVAARDFRVSAVIAQVPYSDGLATALQVPLGIQLKLGVAALKDAASTVLRGRDPVYVPVVGPPGSVAAMTAEEAEPGMRAMLGEHSLWRNEVTARTLLAAPLYRPGGRSENLGMPVLVCVADDDPITPPEPSVRMAERAPRGELRRYPGGHFAIYQGGTFEQVISDQIAFLRSHELAATG